MPRLQYRLIPKDDDFPTHYGRHSLHSRYSYQQRNAGGKVNDRVAPNLRPFSKIGLFFIIVINTSNVAERLIADASWIYLPIALACALLATIGYPLAHYLGKIAGIALEDRKSVTFAVSMRNISSALVLAIAYFPPRDSTSSHLRNRLPANHLCLHGIYPLWEKENNVTYSIEKELHPCTQLLKLRRQSQGKKKILQFGEGNFLRAFVDWMIDILNEKTDFDGNVVIVQPLERGLSEMINDQKGLYTTVLRGVQGGKTVEEFRTIGSVSRCLNPYKKEDYAEYLKLAESEDLRFIVSNTTEAGIATAKETP